VSVPPPGEGRFRSAAHTPAGEMGPLSLLQGADGTPHLTPHRTKDQGTAGGDCGRECKEIMDNEIGEFVSDKNLN